MLKKSWFDKLFLSSELSIETRLTMIVQKYISICIFITTIIYLLAEKQKWYFVLGAMLFSLLMIAASFMPGNNIKRSQFFSTLICLTYVPFLFFKLRGLYGPAIMVVLLAGAALCVIHTGNKRKWLVALFCSIIAALCVLQMIYPDLFGQEPSRMKRLFEFASLLALTLASIASVVNLMLGEFASERELAAQLTEKLENSNKQLAELIIQDPLTGLYNRRHLFNSLEMELESCTEKSTPLCVLMMDLDHFKSINDTYGHGFGDEVLLAFSIAASRNLREYDVLARYGGEEFVAILPVCHKENAQVIAERIRAVTAKLVFRNAANITVSIGLAVAMPGESSISLIARADQNLYQAKKNGRNLIVAD